MNAGRRVRIVAGRVRKVAATDDIFPEARLQDTILLQSRGKDFGEIGTDTWLWIMQRTKEFWFRPMKDFGGVDGAPTSPSSEQQRDRFALQDGSSYPKMTALVGIPGSRVYV